MVNTSKTAALNAKKAYRVGRGIALTTFNVGARRERVCTAMSWQLYPQGKRPGADRIEGWIGLGDGLDGSGKSRPHRNFNPGPSSP
jgi:hypothetical protein